MSSSSAGSVLITLGIGLVVCGSAGVAGRFRMVRASPGDIRIERDTMRVYIPFASMIVISIVLNLVFYLIRRFF